MNAQQKLVAALEAVLCDEMMHVVVNGHLMSEEDLRASERLLLNRMPEIYETARLAIAQAKQADHYAIEIEKSVPFNHNLAA